MSCLLSNWSSDILLQFYGVLVILIDNIVMDLVSLLLVSTIFGGRSLDMDPNFGQYRHFWSTIIDFSTDRNLYEREMQHYLRQRRSSMYGFYLKTYFSWRYISTAKYIKNFCFCKNKSKGFKFLKARIFINSLKSLVLRDNKF